MKIVDKGWAVWRDNKCISLVFAKKTSSIRWVKVYYGDDYTKEGYRVLPTTATATVAKKKARRK